VWQDILEKEKKVYVEPNTKPKAYNPFKIHCSTCRKSVGAISKGGLPCFKSSSNYFQTIGVVPAAGMTCADWRKKELAKQGRKIFSLLTLQRSFCLSSSSTKTIESCR
jgi:hypothetical protein